MVLVKHLCFSTLPLLLAISGTRIGASHFPSDISRSKLNVRDGHAYIVTRDDEVGLGLRVDSGHSQSLQLRRPMKREQFEKRAAKGRAKPAVAPKKVATPKKAATPKKSRYFQESCCFEEGCPT